jgi:hypothetical protein
MKRALPTRVGAQGQRTLFGKTAQVWGVSGRKLARSQGDNCQHDRGNSTRDGNGHSRSTACA